METPNVVVTSYSDLNPLVLAKDILRTEELPESLKLYDEKVGTFPWKIQTKYYTADVHVCTVVNDQFGTNDSILKNMQALVAHFDCQKETTFNRVKMLHSLIDGYEPDVRLLVCDTCSDSSTVSRTEVLTWCLKNGYELVELKPEEEIDSDDDFAETTGMDRVIQALHAHMWSNLIMKEKPVRFHSNLENEALTLGDDTMVSSIQSSACCQSDENKVGGSVCTDDSKSDDKERADEAVKEEDITAILNHLDVDDTQSFESLFERFQIMKERAKNLPLEERQDYAEQVAVAFWKAIGGDEEEIAGLDLAN
ncbi:hypothetical protein CHUAL_002526 [Chamberlinius hualienensis]